MIGDIFGNSAFGSGEEPLDSLTGAFGGYADKRQSVADAASAKATSLRASGQQANKNAGAIMQSVGGFASLAPIPGAPLIGGALAMIGTIISTLP